MQIPNDPITRRSFLRGVLVLVSGGVVVSVVGCGPGEEAQVAEVLRHGTPTALQYPAVMPVPTPQPQPGQWNFFSEQEAATVEALTARILPGTPDDPGAREAGVVVYIDYLLAYNDGFPEATYLQGPFAAVEGSAGPPLPGSPQGQQGGSSAQQSQGQQGGGQAQQQGESKEEPTVTPPPSAPLPTALPATPTVVAVGDYQVIWVPEDQIERYGYQSLITTRDVYRIGVAAVDSYSQERFGSPFVGLSEEQQDQVVAALADGSATGFEPLTPQQLFSTLRRHTGEGMFSDPAYGGNRDMVGWKLIGYPGAARAYTADEIRNPQFARAPQTLAELHAFHAGEPAREGVVLPLSGSDPHTWHDAHEEHNTPSSPLRP